MGGNGLWTPDTVESWRCVYCDATFATHEACVNHKAFRCKRAQEGMAARVHHMRTTDLRQFTDTERLTWERQRAEERGDWTVKGTSAFDQKRVERMERERKRH